MGKPRELYLELSLIGSRAPCENVENQLHAVNYAASCDFGKASFLRRCKAVVEDDEVCFLFLDKGFELLGLSGADVGAGIRRAAPCEEDSCYLNAA